MERKKAILLLEDGTKFNGYSFGYAGEACGEVCFNTSMFGYQEIISDPSCAGQIMTMTTAMVGNYGTTKEDLQTNTPCMKGLVVREYSKIYESWRAETSLQEFLTEFKIPGLEGVDTRKLTRHLRNKRTMRGIISAADFDEKSLLAKVLASPQMAGQDLASQVTTKQKYLFSKKGKYKVIAYDFGIKLNILKMLSSVGLQVTVVPANTPAKDVLAEKPDGIFLSSGPGDPTAVIYAIENTKQLIAAGKPIFGIGLGHQIINLALGAETYQLKTGHRGGNQPVMNLTTNQVEITTQNHGFAVKPESLAGLPVDVTHINLNDQTIEGIAHKEKPVFSLQYQPKPALETDDAECPFNKFLESIKKNTH